MGYYSWIMEHRIFVPREFALAVKRVFEENCLTAVFDDEGNIVEIEQEDMLKMYYLAHELEKIAGMIEAGSWFKISGEEADDFWGIYFDGAGIIKFGAEIVWNLPEGAMP